MNKAKHSLSTLQAGRRHGNVLVLVIVTTMMLFIIGIAFISRNRAERLTVANADTAVLLDAGVAVVVGQINKVLVEDLLGANSAGGMLDGTAGNEYWDYPGATDPWFRGITLRTSPAKANAGSPGAITDNAPPLPAIPTDLTMDAFCARGRDRSSSKAILISPTAAPSGRLVSMEVIIPRGAPP